MKKLIFLAFIFITFSAFSQETISVNYKLKPLKEVLTNVEEKTGFLFSYSEEVVKDKFITLINSSISRAQLLSELRNLTNLKFEKISDTQIIISVPSKEINVCGYLFDAETKEPLPFATIFVKGTYLGTTSDNNGFFQIKKVEPQAVVTIQYLGYTNLEVDASNIKTDDCKNLFLQAQAHSLHEVVLVEYVTKGIDKNVDGSFTLTSDKLGILPGLVEPDIFQSLQLIPGISSLDESASGIQIRGGSPDQNLIYFDGIKMYNTGHFFGMISAINPYITETAKIYKGGASPEYGDRISGVIDISSDKNVPQSTEGGIGINGTHGDAFFKAPLGKSVGLIVSARRSYTDMLQTPTFDALSEKVFQNTKIISNNIGQVIEEDDDDDFAENVGKDEFFFYDGSAKLIIQPSENDNIAISGLFTNNDLDFSIRDDEDLTSDKLVVEKQGASFSWLGTRSEKFHHSLKAYYSNLDSDYNNKITEDLLIEEENIRRNTVEDFGADVNFTYDLSTLSAIKAGYQYSKTNVFYQLFRDEAGDNDIDPDDEEDIPLPDDTRDFNVKKDDMSQAHSLYAEYMYRPKNKGMLSLGVRRSYYSLVDDFFIEPRINAEYPLSRALRLKATAEKRYQPISQLIEFEDTQLRLGNGIWTLSDHSRIPVLESFQFSGGIFVNTKGWTLDIDAYLKRIDSLTSFTNGFTNTTEDLSVGKSNIVGLDVLVRKRVRNYRVWLGYTFNDVEYTFPELQSTPFRGNNDITHNFKISNTLELKNWEFSLGWTYRTGSPFTPADSFNTSTKEINFGSINSLRLPAYHRLDASLLYRFSSAGSNFRGVIGASLQNIYARQVPVSVYYRVDTNPITGQDELDRIQQLSLGFTPNMTFRLYF
ncbi:TonB-dependent receptor [Ancylomarina sp. DW003]|nr:TonB-dependent receptor [Ancylomarina sp. DW003]MDE5421554.1 TonB-dependent receptor [Ancylomarina sp. DW003]